MKRLLEPHEAAATLGMSVEVLARIIREGGYSYVETGPKPHRPPGVGRGRPTWRLTEAQLDDIIKGQSRQVAKPEAAADKEKGKSRSNAHNGWDGVRRVVYSS